MLDHGQANCQRTPSANSPPTKNQISVLNRNWMPMIL